MNKADGHRVLRREGRAVLARSPRLAMQGSSPGSMRRPCREASRRSQPPELLGLESSCVLLFRVRRRGGKLRNDRAARGRGALRPRDLPRFFSLGFLEWSGGVLLQLPRLLLCSLHGRRQPRELESAAGCRTVSRNAQGPGTREGRQAPVGGAAAAAGAAPGGGGRSAGPAGTTSGATCHARTRRGHAPWGQARGCQLSRRGARGLLKGGESTGIRVEHVACVGRLARPVAASGRGAPRRPARRATRAEHGRSHGAGTGKYAIHIRRAPTAPVAGGWGSPRGRGWGSTSAPHPTPRRAPATRAAARARRGAPGPEAAPRRAGWTASARLVTTAVRAGYVPPKRAPAGRAAPGRRRTTRRLGGEQQHPGGRPQSHSARASPTGPAPPKCAPISHCLPPIGGGRGGGRRRRWHGPARPLPESGRGGRRGMGARHVIGRKAYGPCVLGMHTPQHATRDARSCNFPWATTTRAENAFRRHHTREPRAVGPATPHTRTLHCNTHGCIPDRGNGFPASRPGGSRAMNIAAHVW